VAVPVIVGAAALRAARLRRRGIDSNARRSLIAGGGAAVVSTLASQGLTRLLDRDASPWPFAAYRVVLASAVILKLGRDARADTADRNG
jgi:undecaprenyl pyrophosphate phosphatase UppP